VLKSQIGSQFLEKFDTEVDDNKARGTIREDMKIAAKKRVQVFMNGRRINHGSMKDAKKF
jgi:hypothetical protein